MYSSLSLSIMPLDLTIQNLLVTFEECKLDIKDDNRFHLLRVAYRGWYFLGILLKCTSLSLLHTTHTRENIWSFAYLSHKLCCALNIYFQKFPFFLFGRNILKSRKSTLFLAIRIHYVIFVKCLIRNGLKNVSKRSCKQIYILT